MNDEDKEGDKDNEEDEDDRVIMDDFSPSKNLAINLLIVVAEMLKEAMIMKCPLAEQNH